MKITNPFGRRLARDQRTTPLVERRSKGKQAEPLIRWRDNFLPFDRESGQPHEDFAGKARLPILQLALVLAFFLLVGRLVDLKVVRGEDLRSQANTNFKRFHPITASRGIVLARGGEKLVINEPEYQLYLIPLEAKHQKSEDLATWIHTRVPSTTETLAGDVALAQSKDQPRALLPVVLTRDQALQILTDDTRPESLFIEIASRRNYLQGPLLSHALGYMSEIYEEELATDTAAYYLPGDRVGREGIERKYEAILRGKKGVGEVEVDAAGREIIVRSDPKNRSESGHNLVLAVDLEFQQAVTNALASAIDEQDAKSGVAMVMNVKTGEMLSLVSLPSYDNNWFSNSLSQAEFDLLYNEEAGQPLFNRAIAGLFPPASTFKVFVAAGALEEGTITRRTTLSTPGFLTVGGSKFVDWIYGKTGGSFGSLNLVGALARSSDVFFYQVGAGYDSQVGLGSDKIQYYAGEFGMGKVTGIDLPGERAGRVTSASDFELEGKPWYWGDTAHMAIGQGYTTVTPLELLVATAAISNGGEVMWPHLVRAVEATTYAEGYEVEPRVVSHSVVGDTYLEIVREGMRQVVTGPSGTATVLNDLPVAVAGKTGTAQHDSRKEPHAWFVSFAPYENPEIATVVLLEEGGEGSAVAAPVTKEILKWYFENRK